MKKILVVCGYCLGSGDVEHLVLGNSYVTKCKVCKGVGKLDWVSRILHPGMELKVYIGGTEKNGKEQRNGNHSK